MSARWSPNLSAGTESCAGEGASQLPEAEEETTARGVSRVPPPLAEQDTRGSGGAAGEAWPKEGRDTRT